MSDDWGGEARTAEVPPRHGELRSVRQIALVWQAPAGSQRALSSGERMTLGSDPTNDVVLVDPTVSRFHCELRLETERVRVVDLGSRNGTVVDGVSVLQAYLREGSVLSIGAIRVEVHGSRAASFVPMSGRESFGELVGRSAAMRSAFAALERAAGSDATVLVFGETGTGKEGVAHAIHAESARRDGPFVVVDCGSIPETLIESELFGHERGAFTGAQARRIGAFEAASGGTVVLDEIGELPIELQPRLLRVLETRTVRRLGSQERVPLDVRVVAATHRDLRREVSEGRFRADLYYRLAVLAIEVPPLRERPDDLPLLVDVIASRLGATEAQRAQLGSASSLARLAARDWPGNVRELRNELERALVLGPAVGSESPVITAAAGRLPFGAARRDAIAAFERAYLASILAESEGVVAEAARRAGIDRVHFHRLLRKHGVRS